MPYIFVANGDWICFLLLREFTVKVFTEWI